MPARIVKKPGGLVQVVTPGGIKAKRTTMAKAKKQAGLINATDHGWEPVKTKGKQK